MNTMPDAYRVVLYGVTTGGEAVEIRVSEQGIPYFQPGRAVDGVLSQFSAHYDAELATLIGFGTLAVQFATVSNSAVRLVRIPDVFKDLNGVAIGTIVTVWTPAAGKRIRFLGGSISVSASASVLFEDNIAGAFVFRTPILIANAPYTFDLRHNNLLSAANNVLKATSSAAANITGTLYGVEE